MSAIETEVDGEAGGTRGAVVWSGHALWCAGPTGTEVERGRVDQRDAGQRGQRSPWSDDVQLPCAVVFDLAITGKPSRLLERARHEGAIAIEAIEMWLAQGARQMSWITGEHV